MDEQRIVKQVDLKAPASRVWRAVTDHQEFGAWFGVRLEGPFIPGEVVRGRITHPGYEHLPFEARVERMEPERIFSLRWPHEGHDVETGPLTLVEFTLEPSARGTLLTVVESGFENLSPDERARAFSSNEGGWAQQMQNIERHVGAAS